MPYILRTKTCLLAGVLAGVLSGCATLHLPWDKNRVPQATAQNPVVRIVCLWEQAEGRDPGVSHGARKKGGEQDLAQKP